MAEKAIWARIRGEAAALRREIGALPVSRRRGTPPWARACAPVEEDETWLAAPPTWPEEAGETASARDFGAVGDGVTDDSAAVQRAVDSGCGRLRFDPGMYRLRGVALRRDIALVGDGAVLAALPVPGDSGQYAEMFRVENARVTLRGLEFRGLGPARAPAPAPQSLIRAEGGGVRLTDCAFYDLFTRNQAVAGTAIAKRFACVLFAVGCAAVEIDGCRFENLGGEELVFVTPGEGGPLTAWCRFTGNALRNVRGYSFNLFAEALLIRDNRFEGFGFIDPRRFATSLFNLYARRALVCDNAVEDSDCRDVFDFVEGGLLRGYRVRVANNYADLRGGKFACCCGEDVAVENNFVRGGVLYEGFNYNNCLPVVPPVMRNAALLRPSGVRVSGNAFDYRGPGPERVERLDIEAAVMPFNSGKLASAIYEGRAALPRCAITGNLLRLPGGAGPEKYPAVLLDSLIGEAEISGNLVRGPGRVSRAFSAHPPAALAVYPAAFNATTKRLAIEDNTILSGEPVALLAAYCVQSAEQSRYGFDIARTRLVKRMSLRGNEGDDSLLPPIIGSGMKA